MRSSRRRRLARVARFAAVVAIVAAAHSSPHGQDPSPPQQPPTFRAGTNLVRVDVTVIDRKGTPVTSLTADDFDVREDGQPQTVTSFKLVEATGEPTDDQSLPIRNPQHAAAEAAKDDVRVFLVFWDDYHISSFESAIRARDGLTRAVLGAFGPTDLVAFMDPLTTLDAIRFTRDRRQLAEDVRNLTGRRGIYIPPRSVVEEEHLKRFRDVERLRCQVTESAIHAAAAHLGTLREGPNTLVILTEGGFAACGGDPNQRLRDLVQAANASHTAVYVVDPRGLQVRQQRSPFLESLASATGGELSQSNDMAELFHRVVKQASAFYLLGYAKDVPMDGRFHEIKVRVKRPGVEVRSRAGYWAPRAADVESARAAVVAAAPPTAVAAAFSQLLPIDAPRAVDLWVGTAPLDDGRSRVTLAWAARATTSETRHAPERVEATASAGGPVFQGPIAADGTSFDAPPGPLQLVIDVRGADGVVIDHDTRVVSVPDAHGEALAVSTPVVTRLRTAQERRAFVSLPHPPVYAGRDFERTDRLLVRVATSGASRAEEHVAATLLDRSGTPRSDLPVERGPAGTDYQVDLPLSSIAPGAFAVSIQVSRGDERVETLVPFRVLR